MLFDCPLIKRNALAHSFFCPFVPEVPSFEVVFIGIRRYFTSFPETTPFASCKTQLNPRGNCLGYVALQLQNIAQAALITFCSQISFRH